MIRRLAGTLIVLVAALAAIAGCREEERSLALGGQAYLAQCAVCHGTEGRGDGPLAAVIAREGKTPPATFDGAKVASLGRNGVIRAIESGGHQRSGSSMPLWGPHLGAGWTARIADYVVALPSLGEAGHANVVEYLGTHSGLEETGRRTYVLYCSGCHGPHGAGDGFFSKSVESLLQPPRVSRDALADLDDSAIANLLSLEAGHAPVAATMPGWLHAIPEDDRKELHDYLRRISGLPGH